MLTLPMWFWIIYYIILFLTLISGIMNWIRQRYSALSAITIIFSLLVPIMGLVYTVGRTEGLNEFGYLFAQLKARDPWAFFIILGYLYLLVWWYFFVNSFTSVPLYRRVNSLWRLMKGRLHHVFARKAKEYEGKGE